MTCSTFTTTAMALAVTLKSAIICPTLMSSGTTIHDGTEAPSHAGPPPAEDDGERHQGLSWPHGERRVPSPP